uniref:Uncharacterized protein n=1 Tax=Arundo donax TaxID=35708 RepID=A0A0A9HBR1_ARUDO
MHRIQPIFRKDAKYKEVEQQCTAVLHELNMVTMEQDGRTTILRVIKDSFAKFSFNYTNQAYRISFGPRTKAQLRKLCGLELTD